MTLGQAMDEVEIEAACDRLGLSHDDRTYAVKAAREDTSDLAVDHATWVGAEFAAMAPDEAAKVGLERRYEMALEGYVRTLIWMRDTVARSKADRAGNN